MLRNFLLLETYPVYFFHKTQRLNHSLKIGVFYLLSNFVWEIGWPLVSHTACQNNVWRKILLTYPKKRVKTCATVSDCNVYIHVSESFIPTEIQILQP